MITLLAIGDLPTTLRTKSRVHCAAGDPNFGLRHFELFQTSTDVNQKIRLTRAATPAEQATMRPA